MARARGILDELDAAHEAALRIAQAQMEAQGNEMPRLPVMIGWRADARRPEELLHRQIFLLSALIILLHHRAWATCSLK